MSADQMVWMAGCAVLASLLAASGLVALHLQRKSRAGQVMVETMVHAQEQALQELQRQVQSAGERLSKQASFNRQREQFNVQRVERMQRLLADVSKQRNAQPKTSARLLQVTHEHLQGMLGTQREMAQRLLKLEMDVQAARQHAAHWESMHAQLKTRHARPGATSATSTHALRQANMALMAELKEARQNKRTAATQVTELRGQLEEMQAAIAGMPQQRVELIEQAIAQMHANYAAGMEQGSAQVAAKAQQVAEMNARVTRLAREVSFLQGGTAHC